MRHYLVVGPSWVGDMIMAQSLFITLKNNYPGCVIDVIAPEWSLPVLKRMPEVNDSYALAVKHGELAPVIRIRLGLSLRNRGYTHAIVLPRSWKSALVPFVAGVPVRTGYRGEMRYGLLNDIRKLDKSSLKQTVQRYVALGHDKSQQSLPEILYPKLVIDAENLDRLQEQLKLYTDKPVVCMMPGAEYGPAKQWPAEYYQQLARLLINSDRYVWVLGSKKEKKLGDRIVDQLGMNAKNLCGRTELIDVVDLLSCAEQVVTNDSGLMHVAASVDVKVNVIFGSSTPDYTPPLTGASKREIFYLDLECSPCFKRVCPLGHTNCLREIDARTVYTEMVKQH